MGAMARPALAALACALALTGCDVAGSREPLMDSRAPPELAARFYPPQGWAWGLISAGGRPAQRYGVSSPPVVPRAEVVILPGSGESAEMWFETARDLNARGAVVWILDRAGQGGSARSARPRECVHAPDPEADAAAVRALRAAVAQGGPNRRMILLAADDAAAAALKALQEGAPFDALVLSAPRLPGGPLSPLQSAAVRIGLGGLPADTARAWSRDGPDDVALGLTHDPWRGRVRRAWALANPDLRDVGPTLATRAALVETGQATLKGAAPRLPVLVLLPDRTPEGVEALLRRLPEAETLRLKGARPALHLERDETRGPWLAAVARIAGLPQSPLTD